MSYEERCRNLAKARATRMANLKKKKSMSGKGNYTQDYVDESQVNYAGNPLDMFYETPKKQAEAIKELKGENVGKGMRRKRKVKGGSASFMENSMNLGMDMPTKQEIVKGGKMKSAEHQMNIPEAIKNLASLAEKFGLRLIK